MRNNTRIDASAKYKTIEKSTGIGAYLGLNEVKYKKENLEQFSKDTLQRFQAYLCIFIIKMYQFLFIVSWINLILQTTQK